MPSSISTALLEEPLERLPIPNLKDTIKRFLDRLNPLQDSVQHSVTKNAVERSMSELIKLDSKLREYDSQLSKENPHSSYIEQFWYDSYLQYDESVVLNVNPYFQLEDDPMMKNITNSSFGEFSIQVKRASILITSILKFIRSIRHNNLRKDIIRGIPLSMDQYDKLFGSSRIPPGPLGDSCHLQTDTTSHHVVVMYKSQFYWFDVLDINNEPIFRRPEELEWNLYSIIMDGENDHSFRFPWGVFTTENRRTWSNIREYISNACDTINWKNLQIIDSALFVICLDNVSIEDDEELVKLMLCGTSDINFENNESSSNIMHGVQHGTCLNRWYDKLQLIITRNGKAGINFEHTGVDGHTVLRLAMDIYTDSILNFAQSITKTVPQIFSVEAPKPNSSSIANLITIPRKLEWKIDPFLSSSLHFAEIRVSDLISQFEFATLTFKQYGSSHIKSCFSCSPDAFVQMSFQVAYYALYGKFEMTYEPSMTKVYQNGRTEAIRTVSHESKDFVKSMFNNSSTDYYRIQALQAACKEHTRITKECAFGQGQDRHLYAMYCIWKEYYQNTIKIPPIFEDSGWSLLNSNVLSTSNCSNSCLKNFGFGPVSINGFGIGYIICNDLISIVVSSRHRQTKRFVALIEKFLLEICRVFERTNHLHLKSNECMEEQSSDLKYLLSGYDYFDVSITG